MRGKNHHFILVKRLVRWKFIGVGILWLELLLMLSGCEGHSLASDGTWQLSIATVTTNGPNHTNGDEIVHTTAVPITPTVWGFEEGIIVEKEIKSTPTIVTPMHEQEDLEATSTPESFFLEDVPIGKQTRPLNCEFQSASDLLWYYGYPYAWDEIFELVGHDPGGNPHKGFVGRSFDDPPGRLYPNGYGVYAEPIARGLAKVGIRAEVHYDEDKEWLKEQIRHGNPVMVWATADMIVREPEYWTANDGQRIKAVRGEHTFLVIGYDEQGVWVADPWVGHRRYFSWSVFLASWNILDRMSLIILGPETPEP